MGPLCSLSETGSLWVGTQCMTRDDWSTPLLETQKELLVCRRSSLPAWMKD